MNNPFTGFRSFIIYALCLPVAVLLGYMLGTPLQWTSFGTIGIVVLALGLPLLLRFHQALLLLGWNATMIVFFLPGAPRMWLPLVAISLTIAIIRCAIDRDARFISVPPLTWPLLSMGAVVLVTAQATGGIHMRSMGGEAYGGRNYILILAAIAGYFALTSQPIPRERARLYVGFFLLGAITIVVGDVFYVDKPAVQALYWFFPPSGATYMGMAEFYGLYRFVGICGISGAICAFMLARFGIRGIFSARRPWRIVIFVGFAFASLLGGFRSAVVFIVLICAIQFYLEGLHRTRLLPIVGLAGAFTAAVLLPFVQQFPFSVQRALSFLPIDVDPVARMDAQLSTEWRIEMWKELLPQVREYFWLGKGYTITARDFEFVIHNFRGTMRAISEDENWAALASEYHSGPLSVILPFGIWGVIVFLWFLAAAVRVLYRNYRYGDSELKTINAYLFAFFLTKMFMFFFTYGALPVDIQIFVGYVGVSIALNRGVARPALEPVPTLSPVPASAFPQLRPAFQRATTSVP